MAWRKVKGKWEEFDYDDVRKRFTSSYEMRLWLLDQEWTLIEPEEVYQERISKLLNKEKYEALT